MELYTADRVDTGYIFCGIGHRYWLSAVYLLRYLTPLVPKISVSVGHYLSSNLMTQF